MAHGHDNLEARERGTYQTREELLPKIDIIFEAIAGGTSLRKACNNEDVAPSSFIKAVTEDKELFEHYARARKAQAEWLFDSIGMIEDGTLAGKIDPQAAKVVIDARKWRLAKLHPKEYGEKKQVDMISSDGSMSPLDITVEFVEAGRDE